MFNSTTRSLSSWFYCVRAAALLSETYYSFVFNLLRVLPQICCIDLACLSTSDSDKSVPIGPKVRKPANRKYHPEYYNVVEAVIKFAIKLTKTCTVSNCCWRKIVKTDFKQFNKNNQCCLNKECQILHSNCTVWPSWLWQSDSKFDFCWNRTSTGLYVQKIRVYIHHWTR